MPQPNIINNFISKETAFLIHNDFKTKVEEDGCDKNHPNGIYRLAIKDPRVKNLEKISNSKDYIIDIIKLIIDSVSSQFNIPKINIETHSVSYTILKNNQSLPYHNVFSVDKHRNVYSAILYLTDDYEGGEIIFYDNQEYNKSQKYKLDSGSLIYFNGTEDMHHEVLEVISGERANIVFFFVSND